MILKHGDRTFETGDIIKHFKFETTSPEDRKANLYLYEFVEVAYDATNEKEVVIYKALYRPFQTYTRELYDFLAEVDKEKYPNIRQKYKFIVLSEDRVINASARPNI